MGFKEKMISELLEQRFSSKLHKRKNKRINSMKYYLSVVSLVVFFSLKGQGVEQNKTYSISERYNPDNFAKLKSTQKYLEELKIYDLTYDSFDNIKVKGYIIMPNSEKKKYPVLIFNRGGNGRFGMVSDQFIIKFLSKISKSGFIIIGSQLRGSEGSEGIDDFGGKSNDDVLSLFNIINDLPSADTTKIAQLGWSRGGITNFQILKKTNKIKTTINIAGPSDILKTNRKEMFKVYQNRIKNYSLDSVYYSRRVSPIFQIDSIINKKESFLFIHGTRDDKVDISNSHELYEKTKKLGFKSDFIVFKDSDHSLLDQTEKLIQEIILWLKTELI